MKVKGLLTVSLLVAAAMVAFAFYTASLLPEGTQLPTHFDGAGNPDRYTDALPALLFAPGILLLISLVFAAVPSIEPLQDKLEGSAPLLRVSWSGLIGLMIVMELVTASRAYGLEVPPYAPMSAVGVLFVALGNWLPKSRPGFFVGIRTPWTITDTDIWIATHRLAGKLMMLGGTIMVVVSFLPVPGGARVILTLAAILVAVFVPVVHSFLLWRRNNKDVARP